jgi:hypothetical protein
MAKTVSNDVPIMCPRCQMIDKPGAKPMLEINNGSVTCIGCGHTFVPSPMVPPEPDAA